MICPKCKATIPRDPQQAQSINTLESQVQELSQKLALSGNSPPPKQKQEKETNARDKVDKVADLEDELHAVRTSTPSRSSSSLSLTNTLPPPSTTPEPHFPSTQSRLAGFISSRRALWSRSSTPTRAPPPRTSTPNPNLPLEEQLALERAAREAAEEKVVSVNQELEELTQSLFEEANAMVRTEKERVARLEAKLQILETREEDKRRRLTELEKAIGRITRVRSVLENKSPDSVSSVG